MSKAGELGRAALLCLIGGSADAVAYLRFGTFVGAMTGNTILLGIDIVDWRPDKAVYHACVIVSFLLGVIVSRAALLSKIPAPIHLFVTAIMLGASGLIHSEWGAAISAAALGLQNAAIRNIGGVLINTVFITGDLVSLGSAVPQAGAPEQQNKMALLTTAWLAYAAGAVAGAAALRTMSYPMAVPALLAVLAAIVELLMGAVSYSD